MNSAGHVTIRPESGWISIRILGQIGDRDQLPEFKIFPVNPAGNLAKNWPDLQQDSPAEIPAKNFPFVV